MRRMLVIFVIFFGGWAVATPQFPIVDIIASDLKRAQSPEQLFSEDMPVLLLIDSEYRLKFIEYFFRGAVGLFNDYADDGLARQWPMHYLTPSVSSIVGFQSDDVVRKYGKETTRRIRYVFANGFAVFDGSDSAESLLDYVMVQPRSSAELSLEALVRNCNQLLSQGLLRRI